jgi:hypothetical protein
MNDPLTTHCRAGHPEDDDFVEQIVKVIHSVRYGSVHIVIQDSRVVQIDKTEKVRLG